MHYADPDLIRVFAFDPDLLEGVEERAASHLRARTVVRRLWVEPGRWSPPVSMVDPGREALGLLVVDGLLVRTVRLAERDSSEVLGPGDLIQPWSPDEYMSVECGSEWCALRPTILAVLDARFARRVAPWPAVTAGLLARSTRRCRSLVYQATIAYVRHAETRVLLALWHLADRWGKVTPRGTEVAVPLTHQLLAQLTCLQRPTVSAALGSLTRAGEVSRLPSGGWVLHGDPPRGSAAIPAPELVAA